MSMPSLSVRNESGACVHHWLLTAPNGPVTSGFCKRCGATREFQTVPDDTVRSDGTVVDRAQHARAVASANAARRNSN